MTSMEIMGLVLLVLGLTLAGVEMCIPGFGVAGIGAVLCLGIGVILCARTVEQGLAIVLVLVVILALMLAATLFWLRRRKRGPLVLQEDVKGKAGFLDAEDLEYLVGREGVAHTDLRPSGKGQIQQIDFDVLSDGDYIDKGSAIVVVGIRGNKIIVRESARRKL